MKQCKKFLALVLALIMIMSNANLGLTLAVSAAEIGTGSESVTTGELLQNHYGISDAEVALVDGYLVCDTYKYDEPTDALISIDPENKTVVVDTIGNWVVEKVELVASGVTTELEATAGVYHYDCNTTFYIRAYYKLTQAVDNQAQLLNAAANLKYAINGLSDAYKSVEGMTDLDGNPIDSLATIQESLPFLSELADGVSYDLGIIKLPFAFEADAKAAVEALEAQVAANGKLDLAKLHELVVNFVDNASHSELEYLATENNYQATFAKTIELLKAISADPMMTNKQLDQVLEEMDAENYKTWTLFKHFLGSLVSNMEGAVTNEWDVSAMKPLEKIAQYVALENLVMGITPTVVTDIVNPLTIGEMTIDKTQGMHKVAVNVVINTIKGDVNSDELKVAESFTTEIILPAGTSKADVTAAVEAAVNAYLADSAAYAAEDHQPAVVVENMPDALAGDVAYSYTYDPVRHTVTLNGVESTYFHGYLYELPVNLNAGKTYDYTIGGEHYYEGEIIAINADTVITQVEGEDYTEYLMFALIAEQFAKNDAAKDILTSGVLSGNLVIPVRLPEMDVEPAELSVPTLTILTDKWSVPSDYGNNNWQLHYGAEGHENPVTAATHTWETKSVKLQYVLTLSALNENVAATLELINDLQAEADGQILVLTNLYAQYGSLNKLSNTAVMGGVNSMMSSTTFDADPAKNVQVQEHFKAHMNEIQKIAAKLAGNNGGILADDQPTNLLYWYYQNLQVRQYVSELSAELNAMLATDEYKNYLNIFFDANAADLADLGADAEEMKGMIPDVQDKIQTINDNLTEPNTAIDMESENLLKFTEALQAEEQAEVSEAGVLLLKTEAVSVDDASVFNIRVEIVVGDAKLNVSLADLGDYTVEIGEALSAEGMEKLQAAIDEFLTKNVVGYAAGDAESFYTVTSDIDLPAVGETLTETLRFKATYDIKKFNATLEGEFLKELDAKNLSVILPACDKLGWVRTYTVNGATYVVKGNQTAVHAFTLEDLKNGTLNITYTEKDERTQTMLDNFGSSEVFDLVEENGEITGLVANVNADQGGLFAFATELVMSDYSYIELNGEPMFYLDNGEMVLRVQTLINAILADETFGSDKLIELGLGNPMARSNKNLLTATMALGIPSDDGVTMHYNDLTFVLNLNTVPSQLVQVAEALKAVDGSFWFESNEGKMDVHLNLPEKVYEMYLVGMVAAGYKTNDDLTDVNIQVAYAYLCDIIELFADSSITIDTFQNTLEKLHIDRDLSKFGPYLNNAKDIINNGTVEIINNNEFVAVNTNAMGTQINKLLGMMGFDLTSLTMGLVKIEELDYEGGFVTLDAVVSVDNAPINYEAVIIDANAIKSGVKEFTDGVTRGDLVSLIKGQGLANGVDFTQDLVERLNGVGASAIMLLDDIDGNLVFNGTTILDLNGKTVKGDIVGNGTVLIIDSNLAADNCGTVEGKISGAVVLAAGKYPNQDVSAFVADGYKVENGYVRNFLYTVEGDFENLNFVINTDFLHDDSVQGYLPSVKAMAANIVADLVLNRYVYASISRNDKVILDMGMDHILSVLDEEEPIEFLVNELMSTIRIDNATSFMNDIVAQLLDFGGIAEALKNETPVISYKLSTSPWTVKLYNDGDTLDLGICANENVKHDLNLALTFDGSNAKKLINFFEHLDAYVDATLVMNLDQPLYDDRTLYLGGDAQAKIDIDLTVNKEWQTLFAVILAYGNPEKAADLVDAIDNEWELRKLFNKISVEDVFTGLKVMNHETTFGEMADALNVELDAPGREKLEKMYHLALCAFGKGLEKLDITGFTDKTMGMVELNPGTYGIIASGHKNPDVSFRGWTLDVDALLNTTGITVKIFDIVLPEAEWLASAQLGNSLSLGLAFYLPELEDTTGHYVTLTRTYSDGTEPDVIIIPASEWEAKKQNGKTYYFFAYNGLAAKEMIDEITAQVYDADGDALICPYTESVRSYAMRMLNTKHTEENEYSILFVDLLNYGAAAQEYFGYATEDLANNQLTAEQAEYAHDDYGTWTDNRVASENYLGSKLQLKSSIKFGLFFENIENADHAVVSFTNHNGKVFNYETEIVDGSYVVVDAIRAADCYQMVTVEIVDAEGNVIGSVTDSMESYIARMTSYDPLYQAIMEYAVSAHRYFH